MTVKRSMQDEDRAIVGRVYNALPTPREIPSAGIFDLTTHCLPAVNAQWIPHLLFMVAMLDSYHAWQGTDTQQAEARNQIRLWLSQVDLCEREMDMYLRQNPENPCQLEQSQDGETWSLAFDFSLCMYTVKAGSDIVVSDKIKDIAKKYLDEGQGAIAPTFNSSIAQPAIGCHTLEWMVRSILLAAKKKREGEERQDLIIGTVAAALGIGAAFMTGGLSLIVATGVMAGMLATSAALINSISVEEYDDYDTAHELVCGMKEYFDLNGWTEANVLEAVNSAQGVDTESLLYRMGELVKARLNNYSEWSLFLTFAEAISMPIETSNDDYCGCGEPEPPAEPTLVHTFSISCSNGNFQGNFTMLQGVNYRVVVQGVGRTHALYSGWRKDAQYDTTDSFINDRRRVNNIQFQHLLSSPAAADTAYSSIHEYRWELGFMIEDKPLKIKMNDSNYGDNSGTMDVRVYEYPPE